MCPLLTRDWARAMCDNPWSYAVRHLSLPTNRLILLNLQDLAAQPSWTTVGGENKWAQVSEMPLDPGATDIVCDRKARASKLFCTAGTRLDGDLIAVWTVWDGPRETAADQAAREGQAVRALFRHGLRPRTKTIRA